MAEQTKLDGGMTAPEQIDVLAPTSLYHRHGGRITSLRYVEHKTYNRRASWHFIGTVAWDDGSGDAEKEIEISPVCIVCDTEAGKGECDEAMRQLNDYLLANGEWNDNGWKPRKRDGRAALARVQGGAA